MAGLADEGKAAAAPLHHHCACHPLHAIHFTMWVLVHTMATFSQEVDRVNDFFVSQSTGLSHDIQLTTGGGGHVIIVVTHLLFSLLATKAQSTRLLAAITELRKELVEKRHEDQAELEAKRRKFMTLTTDVSTRGVGNVAHLAAPS